MLSYRLSSWRLSVDSSSVLDVFRRRAVPRLATACLVLICPLPLHQLTLIVSDIPVLY
jgi:hypothetical protein